MWPTLLNTLFLWEIRWLHKSVGQKKLWIFNILLCLMPSRGVVDFQLTSVLKILTAPLYCSIFWSNKIKHKVNYYFRAEYSWMSNVFHFVGVKGSFLNGHLVVKLKAFFLLPQSKWKHQCFAVTSYQNQMNPVRLEAADKSLVVRSIWLMDWTQWS